MRNYAGRSTNRSAFDKCGGPRANGPNPLNTKMNEEVEHHLLFEMLN